MRNHVIFNAIWKLRIYLGISLLVIFSLAFTFHKTNSTKRFNKVIVFGDSYSDTGNDHSSIKHTGPVFSPYYQGRFCDGLVWVERLNVPEKYSYAISGAATGYNDEGQNRFRVSWRDVRQQIATYMSHSRQNNLDIFLPLYIIWIGYNDVARNPSGDPQLIVNSLLNAITDLLAVGAKNFLIFNQAPFQLVPAFKKHNRPKFYTRYTDSFNTILKENLAILQKNDPDALIHMFDNHALMKNIIANESSIKFTNTVDQCRKTFGVGEDVQPCPDPKQYVFVDGIHFTSSVHQLIADAVQPFLSYKFRKDIPNSYIHSF